MTSPVNTRKLPKTSPRKTRKALLKFYITSEITHLPVPNLFTRTDIFTPCNRSELVAKRNDKELKMNSDISYSVSGSYLNLKIDLPLLIFACQSLINKKLETYNGKEEHTASISLAKLKYFSKQSFDRTRHFEPINKSLERLASCELSIVENEKPFECKLIDSFEAPSYVNGEKCIKIVLNNKFFFYYRKMATHTFTSFKELFEYELETAQKLYIFLLGQDKSYVDFTYEHLSRVCGLSKPTRAVSDAKKREYINRGLSTLKDRGFLNAYFFDSDRQVFRVTQTAHEYKDAKTGKILDISEIRSNFDDIKKNKFIKAEKQRIDDDMPF